ncbi:MAG: hypothetical protein JAY97_10455 [Candidatus Thiodiazotropha sp. 'RUGA']|nr:hypothetical protein [Candidatus Thiodiazotropha sp. 'RUGA']
MKIQPSQSWRACRKQGNDAPHPLGTPHKEWRAISEQYAADLAIWMGAHRVSRVSTPWMGNYRLEGVLANDLLIESRSEFF